MNLRFFVVPICVAMACADARPAAASIIETAYYDFTFETLGDSIHFVQLHAPGDPVIVSIKPGNPEYLPHYGFGFHGPVMDLQGTTIDLSDLIGNVPPLPVDRAWHSIPDVYYWELDGSVTFGPDNTIADWDIVYYSTLYGEDYQYWTAPVPIESLPARHHQPDDLVPFAGQMAYGYGYANQYGETYYTSAGRWTTSIQNVAVPVPSSLMLLATGLAGLFALRRRECRGIR